MMVRAIGCNVAIQAIFELLILAQIVGVNSRLVDQNCFVEANGLVGLKSMSLERERICCR